MKLSIKFCCCHLKIEQGIENDQPLITTGNYLYYPASSFTSTDRGDASHEAGNFYVFSMLTNSIGLNITAIFIV